MFFFVVVVVFFSRFDAQFYVVVLCILLLFDMYVLLVSRTLENNLRTGLVWLSNETKITLFKAKMRKK